jgi:hypothetical protein
MSLSNFAVVAGRPGVGSTTGTSPFASATCAAMMLSFTKSYWVGLGRACRIRYDLS